MRPRSEETITSRISVASVVSAAPIAASKAARLPSGKLGEALRAKGFTVSESRLGN